MTIQEKITILPEKPGCYLYKNEKGKIIYVGKAKNLKKRVNSYFKAVLNIKTTKLVREIVDVEVIVTNNEKEALLLEENLIKKNKPRFNVLLNDDKHYPYIIVTNEKDPEYQYVRNYNKKFKRSFGPLPDGSSAGKILKVLQLLYPLRRCKGNLGKPCLYYHINQCSGACFKEVPESYYKDVVKKISSFFSGTSTEVKEQLTQKMLQASENLQFEEAGRIKSILDNLNLALFKQNVENENYGDLDIFNYAIKDDKICFAVLFYLNGKLSFKDYVVLEYDNQDVSDLFKNFMVQIYDKNIIPKSIVVPEDINDEDLQILFEDRISKGTKKYNPLLELAKKNAEETLRMTLLENSSYSNKQQHLLEELQKILSLPSFPYHIEMFDVANIYDEFVTGAMVTYKNGYPSKNDFRKYNIDIKNQDDFHRMQDMIYRRYQKDLFNKINLPDLIIMDGGKIQVSAALSQLELLDLKIPVIGLIKNDQHRTDRLLNFDGNEIEIRKHQDVFNFLANIQERVHTFAITGFRKRKEKGIFATELDDVKGLGPVGVKKLINSFNSLSDLRKASVEKLTEVLKNEKIAVEVAKKLQRSTKNEK
jgi:excinuclease ABC subunit C